MFYPLDYIWPIFVRYYRSNQIALPDEGGYDDQDAAKMEDLNYLLAKVNYKRALIMRQYPDKFGKNGLIPVDPQAKQLSLPDKPPASFSEVFGE